jgi:hypothetical protein
MSAKRFSACSLIIVLLAVALIGGGCASLRPPTLETGQAVEAEVRADLRQQEMEGNAPPESVETGMSLLGQFIGILGRALAPMCGVYGVD